ncbi:globin [Gordonia sp. (in: high G+C Gram-positive bacteria)]|uniref:globin n=1 Tax=Gordonia sp. (in: high G+C Gram-positive bacteria) TaxID=84139 RepID=UPI0016A56B87|nr:globin [Gordonia sp. (in: high G+C Gram-positive bacteria)]NLG45476.1 globin [Gordonia sp. (in: high G+C Gram-positive bacteria)]
MTTTETSSPASDSFELYLELAGEPTEAVYERFFAMHPDAKAEFGGDEFLEKRMMAGLLQMLVDLSDHRVEPSECDYWVWDHIAYEVDEAMAFDMFDCVVATLRDGLGDRWTPAMTDSWAGLLGRLRPVLGPTFTQAGA